MRWIYATGLLLAGIGYLAWLAMVDPDIEFLRPAWRGEWIVHPNASIRSSRSPVCPDVTFERQIVFTNLPPRAEVTVAAFRGFRLDVNDVRSVATRDAADWKKWTRLDLRPHLRPGTNLVRITASGIDGPPAALVEGPEELRTGPQWKASMAQSRPVQVVVAGKGERFLLNKEGALSRHPSHRVFAWLLVAYISFIVYAITPLRFKPWLRGQAVAATEPPAATATGTAGAARRVLRISLGFMWRHGICLAMLLAVAVVQYRNVADYPHTRSKFDVAGHVEYLRLAAEKARVPMATDGWEMFQPPAYYFTAATVYRLWGGRAAEPKSLKAVQVFGTTCGLLNLVFALGLLWLLFPDRPLVRNLGFASVAFVPVHFYMDPMITNEVFAGAVIGGALLVACWALRGARPPWIRIVSAILACGVALLSKYTAFFLFLAVGAWHGLRVLANVRSIKTWGVLMSFVAGVLLVSGWYYQRNATTYGNVFIGNWDRVSGFHYEQQPGYRTVGFYARFGSVLFHDPEHSRWSSFWDGQYGSLWADSHDTFLTTRDARTELPAAAILWLALLPTVACLFGFGLSVVRLLRGQWDDPGLALVLLTFFTFTGVIAFTMEVPTYSTIKGFFLLSLTRRPPCSPDLDSRPWYGNRAG